MGCRNLIAFRRMGTGKENCALVPNPAFNADGPWGARRAGPRSAG